MLLDDVAAGPRPVEKPLLVRGDRLDGELIHPNEEIGQRLFVSVATAKTHVSRAMGKLYARDRAQLVVLAYESGLVRPGWLG
ncbi:MAG: hypothetical protein QOF83_2848 [Solirubrobacteraceae bacterium]|nr:two component transcriptional regulator, LuxR family [Chloroflexota bacterium]MEA2212900.1 hypothetical protein [Solirubrobacteraceae bacterium]